MLRKLFERVRFGFKSPSSAKYYVRKQKHLENGDVVEVVEEVSPEAYDESIRQSLSSSPDNFVDAVSSVPDIGRISRFEAIDRLNAAIANINYEKPAENEN